MTIRACKRCRYGLAATDYSDGDKPPQHYVICALLPPQPLVLTEGALAGQIKWVRPPMTPTGFCGQFRIGWRALFGYGARA